MAFRSLVLLTLVVATFLPSAAAQAAPFGPELEVSITPTDAAVLPRADVVAVPYMAHLSCGPGTPSPIDPVVVEFDVHTSTTWASALVDSPEWVVKFFPDDCPSGASATHHGHVYMEVEHTVRADSTFDVSMRGSFNGSEPLEFTWRHVVGAEMNVAAAFSVKYVRPEPGSTVPLVLAVQNSGNGPVSVSWRIDINTTGIAPQLPDPLLLDAWSEGSRTVLVPVNEQDALPPNRRDELRLTAVAASTASTASDEVQEIPLQVLFVHEPDRAADSAERIAVLWSAVALAVLVGIALWARRR